MLLQLQKQTKTTTKKSKSAFIKLKNHRVFCVSFFFSPLLSRERTTANILIQVSHLFLFDGDLVHFALNFALN